jgi:hypothetical protein
LFCEADVKGPIVRVRMFIVSGHKPVTDKLFNTQQEVWGGTDFLLSFHYKFNI